MCVAPPDSHLQEQDTHYTSSHFPEGYDQNEPAGGFSKANLFKSSKKLKFEMQERKDGDQTNVNSSANTSFHEVLPFNLPSG